MYWILFVMAYLMIGYGAGRLCAGLLADNTGERELSFGRYLLRTLMFPVSAQNWQSRFSSEEYCGLRKCFPSNGSGIVQDQDSLVSYRVGVLFLWPYLIASMILGGFVLGMAFTFAFLSCGFDIFKKVIVAGDSTLIAARSLLIAADTKNTKLRDIQPEYDLADLLKDVDVKIQARLISNNEERLKIEARVREIKQLIADCTQLHTEAQNNFVRTHHERLVQCSREELNGLMAAIEKIALNTAALSQQSSQLKEWMRCVELDDRACALLSQHNADVERSAFNSARGALEAVDLEDEFSERIALVQSHLEIKIDDSEIG